MTTGYPKDPNAQHGGYKVLTKDDLRSRIKEIEVRIKQMDRREKALGDLKKWLANRKLEPADLAWMVRMMKPKRANKPVMSKKPLQPQSSLQPKAKRSNGLMLQHGKLVAPKGDPEFRRRIMEARVATGWTSTDVGKKLGVSHATISSWEAGRYVPKEELRVKILKLFELPASLGVEATKAMQASMGGKN
jgi:DNA-binding XRE family transcriptional regulator